MTTEALTLAQNLKAWLLQELRHAKTPEHIDALTLEIMRTEEIIQEELGREDV